MRRVFPPHSQPRHDGGADFKAPAARERRRNVGGGWTPVRQLDFLDALARTGSVSIAARTAGMSRESAYRLRARQPHGLFAAAWNRAVTPASHRPTRGEVEESHIRAIAAACGTEAPGLRRRLAGASTS